MQKLQATHLVDDGVYLIERPWGQQEYEVDGMPVPAGQFVVKALDSIVCVTKTRGELVNWRDAEGNTLTAAEHAEQRAALLTGATQDDDMEWQFQNLDAEFAFRKFVKQWQPGDRAPDVVTRTPCEAEIVEVRVNSGDPDIVSLWNSPTLDVDQRYYSVNRDGVMIGTFKRMCEEAALKYEMPTHSALRFAKIEGEYAFNESFDAHKRPFIGTLAACRAEKAACIDRVAPIVRTHTAKKRGLQLKNAGTVLIGLQKAREHMARVRAKSDSSGALTAANRAIDALISDIQREIAPVSLP